LPDASRSRDSRATPVSLSFRLADGCIASRLHRKMTSRLVFARHVENRKIVHFIPRKPLSSKAPLPDWHFRPYSGVVFPHVVVANSRLM
jgi:hypothetical protein